MVKKPAVRKEQEPKEEKPVVPSSEFHSSSEFNSSSEFKSSSEFNSAWILTGVLVIILVCILVLCKKAIDSVVTPCRSYA